MTVYAMMAEQESENRSNNTKWGLQWSFKNETSKYADKPCYGYKQDREGSLIIDESTAENVKLIFDLYLQGYSLSKIAKELQNRGILTPMGKEVWTSRTIDTILSNEKYVGDVLLQKTYVPDLFKGKQEKNEGQLAQYLYENNHIGIISKELFNVIQEEKKRRSNLAEGEKKTKRASTRYSSVNGLSGKIQCGECGRNYRRITTHKGEIVWKCADRAEGGSCKNKIIKQEEVDNLLMQKFGKIGGNIYKSFTRIVLRGEKIEIE